MSFRSSSSAGDRSGSVGKTSSPNAAALIEESKSNQMLHIGEDLGIAPIRVKIISAVNSKTSRGVAFVNYVLVVEPLVRKRTADGRHFRFVPSGISWEILRRYSAFRDLGDRLYAKYPDISLPPMPTKISGVDGRLEMLRTYISAVCDNDKLRCSAELLLFLDMFRVFSDGIEGLAAAAVATGDSWSFDDVLSEEWSAGRRCEVLSAACIDLEEEWSSVLKQTEDMLTSTLASSDVAKRLEKDASVLKNQILSTESELKKAVDDANLQREEAADALKEEISRLRSKVGDFTSLMRREETIAESGVHHDLSVISRIELDISTLQTRINQAINDINVSVLAMEYMNHQMCDDPVKPGETCLSKDALRKRQINYRNKMERRRVRIIMLILDFQTRLRTLTVERLAKSKCIPIQREPSAVLSELRYLIGSINDEITVFARKYGSTSPEISIISEILLENADLLILLVDYAEELLRSGENSKDVNNKD